MKKGLFVLLVALPLFALLFVIFVASRPFGDGETGYSYLCFDNLASPASSCIDSYPDSGACVPCNLGSVNCRLFRSSDAFTYFRSSVDTDGDNDQYFTQCGHDCLGTDASVNPGASESGPPYGGGVCTDGKDNDCDGLMDGLDPDCIEPFTVTIASATVSGTTVTLTATTTYSANCRYRQNLSGNYDNAIDMTTTNPYKSHTKTITNVALGTHTYYVYCRLPRE